MRTLPAVVATLALAAVPGAAPQPAAPALDVDLRHRALSPGEPIEITVRAPAAVTAVTARLGDRPIAIWPVSGGVWRGLAGLDVDLAPGSVPLTVTATPPSGADLTHATTLDVGPAAFVERRLTVAPRYVEPPAAERARIDAERARLQEIYRTTSADLRPGGFAAPVRHRRSSPFGARSIFNNQPRARHAGLDFASPAGATIRAPAGGRVVLADDLYFTGRTVILDHGQGLYSILAHMTRIDVREGLEVARGAPLGTVGATGRATGPHLHWSVRLGGARVDPAAVLHLLTDAPRSDGR
jgi:murein DD-endopeptidase MepM/ murein hydrolase activator NlpD